MQTDKNALFTKVNARESAQKIGHNTTIVSIGSCFADTMGQKLERFKFRVLANPFGITYHPLAIFRQLNLSFLGDGPEKEAYLQRDATFFHYDFHSSFWGDSEAELDAKLRTALAQASSFIKSAKWLILTFGTAYQYALLPKKRGVTNCHKMPKNNFSKELSSLEDLMLGWNEFHQNIKALNPKLNIICTVSPVRHTKDGMPENMLSKSQLRVFCGELERNHPEVYYFPSYEIMMDELRDYRFYNEDLIHPSPVAEEIIWERFIHCFLSKESLDWLEKLKPILNSLQHRIQNPNSKSAAKFITDLEQKVIALPFDLSLEWKAFLKQ